MNVLEETRGWNIYLDQQSAPGLGASGPSYPASPVAMPPLLKIPAVSVRVHENVVSGTICDKGCHITGESVDSMAICIC
jgi:hypothetical protein